MAALRSKYLRFPVVGAINSLIYALATWVYIGQWHVDNTWASVAGYFTALPFAFVAHRSFTFRAGGRPGRQIARFCAVHAAGVILSWLCMAIVVDHWHLHYGVGIIGVMLLVPVVSFLLFDRWVFVRPKMH